MGSAERKNEKVSRPAGLSKKKTETQREPSDSITQKTEPLHKEHNGLMMNLLGHEESTKESEREKTHAPQQPNCFPPPTFPDDDERRGPRKEVRGEERVDRERIGYIGRDVLYSLLMHQGGISLYTLFLSMFQPCDPFLLLPAPFLFSTSPSLMF